MNAHEVQEGIRVINCLSKNKFMEVALKHVDEQHAEVLWERRRENIANFIMDTSSVIIQDLLSV